MSEAVDFHIGKRLRLRRRMLDLTLAEVGSVCGVRLQQIQKYESGANHVSAAMLWRLAGALGVGTQYFYEGLDRKDETAPMSALLTVEQATETARSAL